MLNSKQRAYLRSLANTMKPITQIGKDGVNERFLEQLDNMLDTRELVKVNILETAGLDAKETANAICNALRAEYVQAIGFKFTLYRKQLFLEICSRKTFSKFKLLFHNEITLVFNFKYKNVWKQYSMRFNTQ